MTLHIYQTYFKGQKDTHVESRFVYIYNHLNLTNFNPENLINIFGLCFKKML